MRLVFIICLLAVTGFAQPIQRQFFTTNPAPDVTVIAGSNSYLSFSLIGGQTRQYKIDVPSMVGQTNNTVLSAGTNVVIVTNVSGAVTVYTVSAVPGVQTNVTLLAAGTNVFVHSATNNGVITYTIDVPTNAIPVQQTNWPWQSITNIATVQIPYASITNPPSDIERTNWSILDITNSLNLTNWALLSTNAFTNVIVAAGSNAYVTAALSGQVRTYTVDVPTQSGGGSSNITDSGYIAVIRNANVQTNLNASNLTVTNPATFQNGLTNAQGTPNALAVYGANTNLIGLANPQNIGGWVLYNGTSPAFLLPKDYSFVIDDFLWVSTPGGSTSYPQVPWEFLFSGTGANNLAGVSTSGHPGTRDFITGTTTSGYSMAFFGGSGQNNLPIVLGGGVFFGEWIVYIPVAASAGDPYWLKCAVSDNSQFSGGAVDNNFVGFTCTTNTSGDFIGTVRAASGTTYTVDSKLAAVGGNWYRLGYLVSADGSSTKFYTNGVLCGTISQAAPTAKLTPAFNVIKTAGTTSVTNTLDLYWHIQLLTTGR